MRNQLQEARWLLKGLQQRGETLLRVVRSLILQQACDALHHALAEGARRGAAVGGEDCQSPCAAAWQCADMDRAVSRVMQGADRALLLGIRRWG